MPTLDASEFLTALERDGTDGLARAISNKVAAWMVRNGFRADFAWRSWLEHYNSPLEGAVGLVMAGGYDQILELDIERQTEWLEFTDEIGFFVENWDHNTKLFYAEDQALARALEEQLAFEWHARLVAPDFAAIHSEIFGFFAERPQRLHDLHPRAFEEILASVFLAQGYRTLLGPGGSDEGVDLRLMENTVYGEEVTVVQVKRYKKAIDLQLVASLSGVMLDQRADRGLFVTTSRYLPSAERFAARQSRRIDLATSKEVATWCEVISSKKSESEWLRHAAPRFVLDPTKIVVASVGYGIVLSQFACVVAETKAAARLALLGSVRTWEVHESVGAQTPDLSTPLANATLITARRTDGGYWADDQHLYSVWDGRPRHYDTND